MTIAIAGSGNVAGHLGEALAGAGHTISAVYSKHPAHASRLARKLGSKAVKSLSALGSPDVILLAVNDDAIESMAKKIKDQGSLVLHHSGSEPLALLSRYFRNCGVLYPVQTFSSATSRPGDIPFCIEASNKASLAKVKRLASSLSPQVLVMSSANRKTVHLAAVFANNFSNHLFALAAKILQKKKIPFSILLPLIRETVSKAGKTSPAQAQTGPAARGDKGTMKEHLAMLRQNRKARDIYKLISVSIAAGRKIENRSRTRRHES